MPSNPVRIALAPESSAQRFVAAVCREQAHCHPNKLTGWLLCLNRQLPLTGYPLALHRALEMAVYLQRPLASRVSYDDLAVLCDWLCHHDAWHHVRDWSPPTDRDEIAVLLELEPPDEFAAEAHLRGTIRRRHTGRTTAMLLDVLACLAMGERAHIVMPTPAAWQRWEEWLHERCRVVGVEPDFAKWTSERLTEFERARIGRSRTLFVDHAVLVAP